MQIDIGLPDPRIMVTVPQIREEIEEWLMVLGNSTHLQTLLLNLLTNALDSMRNGETLTIRRQPFSSENDQWVESPIADTGVEISEEVKKRIFDPFFTTKKMGGRKRVRAFNL